MEIFTTPRKHVHEAVPLQLQSPVLMCLCWCYPADTLYTDTLTLGYQKKTGKRRNTLALLELAETDSRDEETLRRQTCQTISLSETQPARE